MKIPLRRAERKLLLVRPGLVHDGLRPTSSSGSVLLTAPCNSYPSGFIPKRSYSQSKSQDASDARDELGNDEQPTSSSTSDNKISKQTRRSRSTQPKSTGLPQRPPVCLLPRSPSLVKIVPDYSSLPINLSLPPLISPSNSGSAKIPTTFPRPPYLSPKYAELLPLNTDDPYLLTRSVEMFGLPGSTDWIRNLSLVVSKATIRENVSDFLGKLPWRHRGTMALKEAAWAEHLIAMQNPTLKGEADEYDLGSGAAIDAPSWPSEYTSVSSPAPETSPSLSWSSSGERDQPQRRAPSYIPNDEPSYGWQDFPRPRRIARLYPADKSLVLVFASATARRAIMTAYSYWFKRKLREAYDAQFEVPDKAKNALPPVGKQEFGEVWLGKTDSEALQWANEVGWSPAIRLRPFNGAKARKHDEWHTKSR